MQILGKAKSLLWFTCKLRYRSLTLRKIRLLHVNREDVAPDDLLWYLKYVDDVDSFKCGGGRISAVSDRGI